jgi:hypothetical protein
MKQSKQNEKQYFTDLIGEQYKQWKDEFIILDGGTGTGKSTFCIEVLGKYAKAQGKNILYLCNRSRLKEQIQERVDKNNLDNIDVMCYQKIEKNRKNNIEYDYIIVDECHYFTSDSVFNGHTNISFDVVYSKKDCVVLWVSATASVFFKWLRYNKMVADDRYYHIKPNNNHVKGLFYYDKKELIPLIKTILELETDSKIVVFVSNVKKMLKIYDEFGEQAFYYASDNNKNPEIKNIINRECIDEKGDSVTFDKRLLITTTSLDNGIDLKDPKINYIFSELFFVDDIIQSLGRKRAINDNDFCYWYILNRPNYEISGKMNFLDIKENLKNADLFKKKKADNDEFEDIEFNEYMKKSDLSFVNNKGELELNKIAYTGLYLIYKTFRTILSVKNNGFIREIYSRLQESTPEPQRANLHLNALLGELERYKDTKILIPEGKKEIKDFFERYTGQKLADNPQVKTFNKMLDKARKATDTKDFYYFFNDKHRKEMKKDKNKGRKQKRYFTFIDLFK